jgi:hypothetical protein
VPCLFFIIQKNMSNRNRKSRQTNALKQEITLMTLLANESTSDSRKLLKKYGWKDADNHKDLEIKLAELYTNTPDKIQLEKELASIHPHKNWILKYYPQTIEVIKEEPKKEETLATIENNSQADGGCGCNSNFDAISSQNISRPMTTIDYVAILGVVGIIGLSFYVISKSNK